MENLAIIYEDKNLLAIDKPAGINSDDIPLRVHRLDKDTSGVLLVAKNNEALEFLQKQFSASASEASADKQERKLEKRYLALVMGNLKQNSGRIETLIDRSPRDRKKQKAFLLHEPKAEDKRMAITEYKVLERFKDYTLVEVYPKTGRKHQIRCHLTYLGHPIAGDKMYGFKNQLCPKGLNRHFLHASYLKITLPDGKEKEFKSNLPLDLTEVLEKLEIKN